MKSIFLVISVFVIQAKILLTTTLRSNVDTICQFGPMWGSNFAWVNPYLEPVANVSLPANTSSGFYNMVLADESHESHEEVTWTITFSFFCRPRWVKPSSMTTSKTGVAFLVTWDKTQNPSFLTETIDYSGGSGHHVLEKESSTMHFVCKLGM